MEMQLERLLVGQTFSLVQGMLKFRFTAELVAVACACTDFDQFCNRMVACHAWLQLLAMGKLLAMGTYMHWQKQTCRIQTGVGTCFSAFGAAGLAQLLQGSAVSQTRLVSAQLSIMWYMKGALKVSASDSGHRIGEYKLVLKALLHLSQPTSLIACRSRNKVKSSGSQGDPRQFKDLKPACACTFAVTVPIAT